MKFFVSTGEASGDLHISYIAQKLFKLDNSIAIYGAAGKNSEKVGLEVIQDIKELAFMGFSKVITSYRFLKNKEKKYLKFIEENNIKNIILVDYGGFNLRFLKDIKKKFKDIKVFYYIPPKLWVWGEKRIEKLKLADHIIVIFPWEVEYYKKFGVEAAYFGNPFYEVYKKREKIGDKILLLPGSRKQEVKSLLPVMLSVVKRLKDKKFILKLASSDHINWINEDISKYENLEIENEKSLTELSEEVFCSIAASGTVTLELALLGIPVIVGYKVSVLNEFIIKNFLDIKYISLPNITLDKKVFPELLQKNFNEEEIMNELENFNSNYDEIQKDLDEIINKLKGNNITENYAKYILERKL